MKYPENLPQTAQEFETAFRRTAIASLIGGVAVGVIEVISPESVELPAVIAFAGLATFSEVASRLSHRWAAKEQQAQQSPGQQG